MLPHPLWLEILGWCLAATSAVASVPQALRTVRSRNSDGLSLTTQLYWVLSWLMWLYYSVRIGAV